MVLFNEIFYSTDSNGNSGRTQSMQQITTTTTEYTTELRNGSAGDIWTTQQQQELKMGE